MHESIVFCSTCTMSSYRKFTFAISSPDEFLVIIIIIIERKDLGGVMSKDCKDTLQMLKTVIKYDCNAK